MAKTPKHIRKSRARVIRGFQKYPSRVRVILHAIDIVGDAEKAARWMTAANRALGCSTPMAKTRTEAGAREVEAVLGRIESGVFS